MNPNFKVTSYTRYAFHKGYSTIIFNTYPEAKSFARHYSRLNPTQAVEIECNWGKGFRVMNTSYMSKWGK